MLLVRDVEKSYKKGGFFSKEKQKVLNKVTLECRAGECLGIIGESGSGKSTLGRMILGVEKPDSGSVTFKELPTYLRKARLGKISAVFQDYKSSINPFFTVKEAILEPLQILGRKDRGEERLIELLKKVDLPGSYLKRYPHELSGGEVQRVCIARAIATEPACILFDEAISSLDVSVQVQVLDLLKELKRTYNMSYIFITHDIQAAAYLCDRMIIFKDGQIEETVNTQDLGKVQTDYAKKLLHSLLTI
ncbi:peptide ABC transporter ATP-binding protein [Bacillus sp. LL01]|uniref:ABC transporter ATP-binding protein n=1 Tax=Bacillus sp. LL01 TaxID=1665556 RepID=UPI00064D3D5C|nr:ABC transporter ATP-binding protein [Bacillus sp. LL01]KMJ57206.1 peptide ABC transporter ATP-binding protein [Bacillus sp. LL01]